VWKKKIQLLLICLAPPPRRGFPSLDTHTHTQRRTPHTRTGPPYVLASLIPGRVENTALDVTFTDDVRISVSVIPPPPPPAAAVASASSEASGSLRSLYCLT
jgi:hypothetical protein